MQGNSEGEQRDDRTARIPSFQEFDASLAAVNAAWEQLVRGTWAPDVARLEVAARAAVASLLQASAELRRLEPTGFRGPRWRIAAFALEANRREIVAALARTRLMVPEPGLQALLEGLAEKVDRDETGSPAGTRREASGP